MRESVLRRAFLQKCFTSALQLSSLLVIIESCGTKENAPGKKDKEAFPSDPCSDVTELNDDDIKKRLSMGYVQKSPSANKHCGNCNLWLPPATEKSCGKCQLFKGPVPAEAYCVYWAPQV